MEVDATFGVDVEDQFLAGEEGNGIGGRWLLRGAGAVREGGGGWPGKVFA